MNKKQIKKLETLLARTEALENEVYSEFARERLRDAKDHLLRLWKDPSYDYSSFLSVPHNTIEIIDEND